jgi:multimeric flavodoxin WrbA
MLLTGKNLIHYFTYPTMKVLGIATSPRKGTSQSLIEHILSGAEKAGAETELLRLCDLDIKPCTGCGVCKTDVGCNISDDMDGLYQKLVKSDVVVVGSPIYWFRLNAQAYPFIDRFYGYFTSDFACNMPKGKKIVTALTCGGDDITDMNNSNEYLKKVFQFLGFVDGGYIWQNNCMSPDDIAKYPDKIKEAEQLGRTLVK